MQIPTLTSKEMAELDRKLVEDYHIELRMMMENAGRALAVQASRLAGGSVLNKGILVMAGKGNNGGGAGSGKTSSQLGSARRGCPRFFRS